MHAPRAPALLALGVGLRDGEPRPFPPRWYSDFRNVLASWMATSLLRSTGDISACIKCRLNAQSRRIWALYLFLFVWTTNTINKPTNQPTNQRTNQPTSQPTSQPASQSHHSNAIHAPFEAASRPGRQDGSIRRLDGIRVAGGRTTNTLPKEKKTNSKNRCCQQPAHGRSKGMMVWQIQRAQATRQRTNERTTRSPRSTHVASDGCTWIPEANSTGPAPSVPRAAGGSTVNISTFRTCTPSICKMTATMTTR